MNLHNYVGQEVLATYRDGKQGTGVLQVTDSHNYPFRFASGIVPKDRNELTYTESGLILMFMENHEDIVSIERVASKKKKKKDFNLEQYFGHRVRVAYRDGSQAVGWFNRSGEITQEHWPFLFDIDNEDDVWDTYTEEGHIYLKDQHAKDIMSIEILDYIEKDSAVEKMALALLPAVFTSLESDPNLEHAIEAAIRGTFLAMFGEDVTGETLNHSVSVIKSRISLSVKQ